MSDEHVKRRYAWLCSLAGVEDAYQGPHVSQSFISRDWLCKKLVRTAQVRSVITLSSSLVAMCSWGYLPVALKNGWTAMGAVFGVPLLVCWISTIALCRRMVKCPVCGESLWQMGSGSFKPRRMIIKANVDSCPHCGAPIK